MSHDPLDELPRRPVEPLAPPPGQFDVVLSRANRRRQRHAAQLLTVLAVFLAGVGGGMSVDGGVRSVPQAIIDLTTDGGADAQAPPPVDTSTSATVTPEVTTPSPETRTVTQTAPATEEAPPQEALAVHGRALSTDGTPLAGLYVYPGAADAEGFVPVDAPVAVTDKHGLFSLACPGTPVLLSPWPVNQVVESATAEWAATFVGGATQPSSATDAPCSRSDKVIDVVLQRGATVSGTAEVPAYCDDGRPLRVLLHGEPSVSVRLADLRDGDTFAVGGLPPGVHTLAVSTTRTSVTVAGSATTTQDIAVVCEAPLPSETPTPTPDPTETSAPPPSESPTAAPEPTPGNTSSPSPTPTPAPTTR